MDKSTKLDFSGYNIYVGLDTHLKSWRVTTMVEDKVYQTFSQEPNAEALKTYLAKRFPKANYHSAYEASFCGFHIHRKLLALGINSIIVNPADIPTTDKERKQKEDTRDNRKIAKQLSQSDLVPIYVPDIEIEGDRQLVRYRKTISKEITRSKNRIKSQLHFLGIEIPPRFSNATHWPKRFTQWLEEVEVPTNSAKIILDSHLETVTGLRKKQLMINRAIRQISKKDIYNKNYNLLISIPGIGALTSMIILTEIGDISRFENFDHLSSFVGFVPMTNSTGEKDKVGDITIRRNSMLRGALIESAWVAIKADPVLMLAYQNLTKRMVANRAIVRIAKKLLSRIRYVLINQKPYEKGVVE